MPTQLIGHLEASLSTPRLNRYRPNGATSDADLETLVNYFWNMALADTLLCSLGAVEIALRNTIHNSLSAHFGAGTWYDQTGLLDGYQRREVENAKAKIRKDKDPVTPDRVIGALTFGFWVTILSSPYDARLWRAANASSLRAAFPYVRKSDRPRNRIHRRYNEIRELRNRVTHHEPLFDDGKLARRHNDVLWGLHWINPHMQAVVRRFDRFPDVYANGRKQVVEKIKAHTDAT